MTQEDKELLLKDLCARLPYGVKYDIVLDDGEYGSGGVLYDDLKNGYLDIEDLHIVRPYLRPMSSMTEQENHTYWCMNANPGTGVDYIVFAPELIDWLNAHHFDYRGLIEKGLAIEAPDGMYK